MSPPTITALEPVPHRPQRVVVSVDDRPLATLPQKLVEQLGLTVGQSLDQQQLQGLQQAGACDRAVNEAGAMLARRMLSVAEVAARLAARGYAADIVGAAIERLGRLGLINDEQLGRALLEETLAKQPAGPALLRAKLTRRRLDAALIERLVGAPPGAGTTPGAGAFAGAVALARSRLSKLAGLDRATQKRRLYGLLARRGFEEDTVQRVMEEIFEDCQESFDHPSGRDGRE